MSAFAIPTPPLSVAVMDDVLDRIHCAALAELREVHLRTPFWSEGGQRQTADWLMACAQLRRLGYEVEFRARQLGHPNVEMFTRVRWPRR